MPRENNIPLEFPLQGIDTSVEFGTQPPGTTAEGVNVRAQDQIKEQFRGGSRHGLSKLLPDQVNGNAPIQSLSILVSTDPDAINTDYDQDDARSYPSTHPDAIEGVDWIEDPSTNNNAAGHGDRNTPNPRAIPSGGSGRPPVKPREEEEESFCRTYHVANGFEESFSDFTICTGSDFPFDFTGASGGSTGNPFIAPGPDVPSVAEINQIIQEANGNSSEPYDDFTDEGS